MHEKHCQDLQSHSDAPVTGFGRSTGRGTVQSVVAADFFPSFFFFFYHHARPLWAAHKSRLLVPPQRYCTCLLGCTHPCCLPPVWWYKATRTDHCAHTHTHSVLEKKKQARSQCKLGTRTSPTKRIHLGLISIRARTRFCTWSTYVSEHVGLHLNLFCMNTVFPVQHFNSSCETYDNLVSLSS